VIVATCLSATVSIMIPVAAALSVVGGQVRGERGMAVRPRLDELDEVEPALGRHGGEEVGDRLPAEEDCLLRGHVEDGVLVQHRGQCRDVASAARRT